MLDGLWHWTAGVFGHIDDVSPYWLALALALKTAESALIGVGWRNILRAAYPKAKISFNEIAYFLASHRYVIPLIVAAAAVVIVVLWPRLKPRVLNQWRKAKQGAAIFSDWGRYGREVALPSGASYACRIGVNVVFMATFGIPVTAFTVFLVASSHMLSGLFAVTPGGVGQTQALDVATLRGYAGSSSIAAFSVTQGAVMTLLNVVLGLAVTLWAFGFDQVTKLLSKSERRQALEQPSS